MWRTIAVKFFVALLFVLPTSLTTRSESFPNIAGKSIIIDDGTTSSYVVVLKNGAVFYNDAVYHDADAESGFKCKSLNSVCYSKYDSRKIRVSYKSGILSIDGSSYKISSAGSNYTCSRLDSNHKCNVCGGNIYTNDKLLNRCSRFQ